MTSLKGITGPVFAVDGEHADGVLHLRLRGELDVAALPSFESALGVARIQPHEVFVLDLEGLHFIDSTGLRGVLGAQIEAERHGRGFMVRGAAGRVRAVLDMTRTRELLEDALSDRQLDILRGAGAAGWEPLELP